MKNRIVITAIFLGLFMASSATAAHLQADQNSLSDYKKVANQNSERLPVFVKDLVRNKNINFYIERSQSENVNLSVQMDGTKVETIENGSLDNPDIEVWTSSKTIHEISDSDKPVDETKSAINQGDIEYQSNDTWTTVKLFIAETFMNFL